jgi:hypothetical protein
LPIELRQPTRVRAVQHYLHQRWEFSRHR